MLLSPPSPLMVAIVRSSWVEGGSDGAGAARAPLTFAVRLNWFGRGDPNLSFDRNYFLQDRRRTLGDPAVAHVVQFDAPVAETAESRAVRRLRTWSRLFVAVFGICLAVSVTLGVVAVLAILFYQGDQLQIGPTSAWIGTPPAPAGFVPFAGLPLAQKLAYALVAAVRAAPSILLFWNLRGLFLLYEKGLVFGRDNARRIRWAGVWLIADALAPFACHAFLSLTGLEIDRGWAHVLSLQELVLGGVVFVIAQVMQLGREIEEERGQFV
jgi:hypothetical protein